MYRVTLVVTYLGWDDYQFGHSTVRPFLPGRGEFGRIGWIAVVEHQYQCQLNSGTRPPETRVTLYVRGERPPVWRERKSALLGFGLDEKFPFETVLWGR